MYLLRCTILALVTVSGFHVTGGSWVLEVGRTYEITVQVYDQKNHGLFIAEVCVSVCVHVHVHAYVCACVVLYVHDILTHVAECVQKQCLYVWI